MKKLSLKNLKLEATDVLQRDQLKTVLGGGDLPVESGDDDHYVKCADGSNFTVSDCHEVGLDIACFMHGGWRVCV